MHRWVGGWWGGLEGVGQQDTGSEGGNALPSPRDRSLKANILPLGPTGTGWEGGMGRGRHLECL